MMFALLQRCLGEKVMLDKAGQKGGNASSKVRNGQKRCVIRLENLSKRSSAHFSLGNDRRIL